MIRWIEGFESWSGLYTQFEDRYLHSVISAVSFSANIQTGRHGYGKSWQPTALNQELGPPLISSPGSTIITGAAFRLNTPTSGGKVLQVVDSSENAQLALWFTEDYRIEIRRGEVPLGISEPVLQDDEWFYLELKANIRNDDFGWVQVRMNETKILEVVHSNTSEQGSSVAAGVRLYLPSLTWGHLWVDDWYICDDSGSRNNDFLGDVIVEAIDPVEDFFNEWDDVPVETGEQYKNVDDTSFHDEVATINFSNTDDQKETYRHSDLLIIGGRIKAVQQTSFLEMSGGATGTIKYLVYEDASNEALSGDVSITTSDYQHYGTEWEQQPIASRQWRRSDFRSLGFGCKRISEV